jgi:saccharopine dehydrogenase (NAD+, L-lysine forming)
MRRHRRVGQGKTGASPPSHSMPTRSPNTVALIKQLKPDLLLNVALPYQDLALMDACLKTGVDYLDTANYEPPDEAKFEYKWQWAYRDVREGRA